jgi:hypothetical protein
MGTGTFLFGFSMAVFPATMPLLLARLTAFSYNTMASSTERATPAIPPILSIVSAHQTCFWDDFPVDDLHSIDKKTPQAKPIKSPEPGSSPYLTP